VAHEPEELAMTTVGSTSHIGDYSLHIDSGTGTSNSALTFQITGTSNSSSTMWVKTVTAKIYYCYGIPIYMQDFDKDGKPFLTGVDPIHGAKLACGCYVIPDNIGSNPIPLYFEEDMEEREINVMHNQECAKSHHHFFDKSDWDKAGGGSTVLGYPNQPYIATVPNTNDPPMYIGYPYDPTRIGPIAGGPMNPFGTTITPTGWTIDSSRISYPESPKEGQLFFDTANKALKVYTGGKWLSGADRVLSQEEIEQIYNGGKGIGDGL
jgi:hypothetical protein